MDCTRSLSLLTTVINHSLETALVKVQNDLLRALNDACGIFLVPVNLLAAFDTLDHNIMLDRLESSIQDCLGQRWKGWIPACTRPYPTHRHWWRKFRVADLEYRPIRTPTRICARPRTLYQTFLLASLLGILIWRSTSSPMTPSYMFSSKSRLQHHSTCSIMHTLESCVAEIQTWMAAIKLCLTIARRNLLWSVHRYWNRIDTAASP